jgi:hypothetical protein
LGLGAFNGRAVAEVEITTETQISSTIAL